MSAQTPQRPTGNKITEQDIIDFCFQHDGRTAAEILGLKENTFYQWQFRYRKEGELSLKKKQTIIKAFGFEPVTQYYKFVG